ncbi:huntingtin-like, partial [Stegodyphus dumicola]|uniref:huntingtin-like n=1 Tax=Stegodyphus dumicola TaxID=202533 RepID=UPI0015B1DCAD
QNSVIPSSTSVDESALEDDQDIYIPDKKVDDQLCCYEEDSRSNFDQSGDGSVSFDGDSEDISDSSNVKIHSANDEMFVITSASGVYTAGTPKRIPFLKKGASDESMLDTDDEFWDSTSTPSPGPASRVEYKIGNIGTFTDADIPLKYCARLLCSSFLLSGTPGSCIPDKHVRISVKSLALACLSSILSFYPKGFFLPLNVVQLSGGDMTVKEEQYIWDVILYATHCDPHIRGQTAVMIGHFLLHSSQETGGWWSKWLSNQSVTGSPTVLNLLSKLMSVVQDDSSVASKLGLVGLKQCINMLLNSLDALECFHLLETLLQVKDNSYWLTKIELAEVVSSISFKVVNYLEGESTRNNPLFKSTCYQDKFLNGILIPLLGDEDFRVRQASAVALVKLVRKFFFPIDHPNKDPITAIAKESTDIYLNIPNKGSSHSTLPLVHGLVKPFAVQSSCSYNPIIDASLSRIVSVLVTTLRMCTNKYLIYGCCHALCLLSEEFLVTVFPETWNAIFSAFKYENICSEPFPQLLQPSVGLVSESASNDTFSQTSDILCHLISLITHTSVCLDLVAHQHVLQLTGNLLCGLWYKFLVEFHNSNYQELKQDAYVFPLVEKLFLHLMRVLNIFTHVLEEQYPISVSNRPALPSLPNAPSLSPIKRKGKVKDEPVTSSSVKGSPSKGIDKSDTEKERASKISGTLGQFHTFPLYMKLYEILRGAYGSYKISMDFQSSEKFCHLLKCTLDVMSQILEVSESHEMGKSAEEILCYLKSLMVIESCSSVQCVRQLLKSLFGTNLIALCQEALLVPGMCSKGNGSSRLSSTVPGLYHTVISYPYTDFTHVLKNKTIKCLSSEGNDELVR